MTQIAMTPAEFATIEAELKAADPGEVTLAPTTPQVGVISGTHPMHWIADYAFTGTNLNIKGRGLWGGRIEGGIVDKLTAALATMRAKVAG